MVANADLKELFQGLIVQGIKSSLIDQVLQSRRHGTVLTLDLLNDYANAEVCSNETERTLKRVIRSARARILEMPEHLCRRP
jgi:hypothetical protein